MLWSLSADAWFEIKKDEKLKEEKYFFGGDEIVVAVVLL
jgi:hypothetical protein